MLAAPLKFYPEDADYPNCGLFKRKNALTTFSDEFYISILLPIYG